MTGKTHLAFGFASGVGLVYVNQESSWLHLGLTIFVAGAAALLPDIDIENSKINNLLFQNISPRARSTILTVLGVLLAIYYVVAPNTPLWVLLTGIFLAVVAFAPHRTITHSIVMCAYIGWVFHLAMPELALAVVVGYASHILADMLTVSGVQLFWPLHVKVSLSQIGIKIKTGSWVDTWMGHICMLLTFVGIFYLFI